MVGGWSYMRDIKELKGRKQRKKYLLLQDDVKPYSSKFKPLGNYAKKD